MREFANLACMKRILTLLIAAAACFTAGAYNDHRGHNLDSLERAVARWTPDAIDKASTEDLIELNNAYRNLILGYQQLNGEKTVFYARKALEISTRENWPYANADALRYIGQYFWAKEQYDSALVYFTKAMENVDRMEAGGTSPTNPDGYSEAQIDDNRSALYGAIGNLYNEMGNITLAMEYYAKAGALFDKHGWNVSNSVLNYNIGETWTDEGDFRAAEKAYNKGLDYARAAGDSLWIALNRKGLGRLYMEKGQTWKALRELYSADEYFSLHDKEESISRKENFEYMSMALTKQRKQLIVIAITLILMALMAVGIIIIGKKLRSSRKEQAEAGEVIEEAIRDIGNKGAVKLSDRERQVLELIVQGKTNPEIADKIFLSQDTVKWYRKKLLAKFDARNSADLVRKAMEQKVL